MTNSKLGTPWVPLGIFILLVSILVVAQRYSTPTPSPIKEYAMGENFVKEGYKIERRKAGLSRATAQAEKVYRRHGCGTWLASYTGQAAVDYGVSPKLLAALVFVESSCRPNASDGLGSIGLTQVNAKTWRISRRLLLDPETNIRVGARVLSGYIRRFGVIEGLHHYNGYSEEHEHTYVRKVLTAAN